MRRLIPAIAVILGWTIAAWAAAPGTLTTVQAIHALSNSKVGKGQPAEFEATVTYFRNYEKTLFVQDGDVALYVLGTTNLKLLPGDRILVKGRTNGSFHPIVVSSDITLLHHDTMPKAHRAGFAELIRGQRDCELVTVRGVIRAADLVTSPVAPVLNTTMQLLTDGGYVQVTMDRDNPDYPNSLLDAEVEVTGVAGGLFDGKMQQTGVVIHVSGPEGIRILKHPRADLWAAPITPMNEIIAAYSVRDTTQRVRVQGTITYYLPGSAVVLQSGGRSLWIRSRTHNLLRIGDLAEASGFPDVYDGFLTLTRGEIRDDQVQRPITPQPVTWKQLAVHGNILAGHHDDLVSIEGQVELAGRGAAQDEYILLADGHPFSVIYRHMDGPLPSMKQIPLGSKVRVTGICTVDEADPYNQTVPFEILLRSFDDIAVVAQPSLLNIHNLILMVGLLLIVVFVVIARGWGLERRMRRQTAALARIEQHRSRILEDINGSKPLAEILEQITEMVSSMLHGVPCWCQITGGARLGNCPRELSALHVVSREISARSGPPIGVLSAAFNPRIKPSAIESEDLSGGAELATLAIETRRRDADLRHRSEFDLLTDVHNRFSLERRLNAQIDEARQKAGIFGLIYIDLDEFKQVNDLYGHHIGDLYLQEVTLRLKRQLRPCDLLARLGGDEFAVLLPTVRDRAGVEEVVARLKNCFSDAFFLEDHHLRGTASFGFALYPEDSSTADSLLNAADAAMYVVKNSRRESKKMSSCSRFES
jgi:diguanylate cyclase (GGDEF)-like protein